MTKEQYIRLIKSVIESPRNNLQKINMIEQGFKLYVAEHEDTIEKLAKYEDLDLSPEEFKESVDFILELNAKVHKVIEDLRYYLDTNLGI